jgi:hypothetical protein
LALALAETAILFLFWKQNSDFWSLFFLSWTPLLTVFLGLVGDGFNEIVKHILLAFMLVPCSLFHFGLYAVINAQKR